MNSIILRKAAVVAALFSFSGLGIAQPAPGDYMPKATPSGTTAPPTDMAAPSENRLERALANCEAKPVADRQVCRDQVTAQFNSGRPIAPVKSPNDCKGLTGAAQAECIKGSNPGGK